MFREEQATQTFAHDPFLLLFESKLTTASRATRIKGYGYLLFMWLIGFYLI